MNLESDDFVKIESIESSQSARRFQVELSDEDIDDLPERISAAEFAGNVVREALEQDVRPTDAVAQKCDQWVPDGKIFDVVVFVE